MKYNIGDRFTIANNYRRRTFWQWLSNNSKELQQFVITAQCSSHAEYKPLIITNQKAVS